MIKYMLNHFLMFKVSGNQENTWAEIAKIYWSAVRVNMEWNRSLTNIRTVCSFLDYFLIFHVMIFNHLWNKWIIVSTYTSEDTLKVLFTFFPIPIIIHTFSKLHKCILIKEKRQHRFSFSRCPGILKKKIKKKPKEKNNNTRNSWTTRGDLCKQ